MKHGAVLIFKVFFLSQALASEDLLKDLSPQELAKEKALQTLSLKIEEEKANFSIRHYLNMSVGEKLELWPEWENQGVFYRTFILPHVSEYNLSFMLPNSPQSETLLDKKPLVHTKVSTHEQEMTLSEVVFEVVQDKVKVSRKLFDRNVTLYRGKGKSKVSEEVVLPTIFKTTTGAKVTKYIYPEGRKQVIVAYTQPGVYIPVYETSRRVSEDFPGAVLYDYVYFNQGDALHRTRSSEADLGKKNLIGTMEASGGCARMGAKEAAYAREKIRAVGLPRSRIQVVETEDVLSCVSADAKEATFYLASDRTSGVLIDNESKKPLFVGLRGETSWKASSLGRKIILSTMPEIVEGTVEELPKIEMTYATLQDKSPFKAFGKEYSVTVQKQILSLNVKPGFNFEELSASIRGKEEIKETQLSFNCKKTN